MGWERSIPSKPPLKPGEVPVRETAICAKCQYYMGRFTKRCKATQQEKIVDYVTGEKKAFDEADWPKCSTRNPDGRCELCVMW